MKNILLFLFLGSSLLIFNGCEKDPCEATICNNGGYCANGDCVCPEGFKGADCSQQETPTKIRITKIEVTGFPATDGGGAGWDLISGADILPVISRGTDFVWTSPVYFEDANPSSVYSYTDGLPFDITSPQDRYTISLYDYDTIDDDDFMGGVIFTPYFNTNKFPETMDLSVDGSDVSFKIHLSYVW